MPFSSKNILMLKNVDSTNNYAMGLIQKGEGQSGKGVFAMEQTCGKGRRNKEWKSHKGMNIILTLMFEMQWLKVFHQFQLSAAVALGCHDLISKYIPLGTSIKWPNDIFINDRKAGGILIENILKGTLWQWSIIGIGINVNQTDFDDYHFSAVSLKNMTDKNFNVFELAEELYVLISQRIDELKSGNFSKMLEEYNGKLFAKNQLVRLKKENFVFETTITGVSISGQLITQDIFEKHFYFDEIEFKGLV